MMKRSWAMPLLVVLVLLVASGLACGRGGQQGQEEQPQQQQPQQLSSSPPVVRLISPPAGSQVAVGRELFLQARAFARGGLGRVEFAVNGSGVGSQSPAGGQRLFVAVQAWTPTRAGSYTLSATAYDATGQASTPSQATITVQESFAPSGGASSGGQSSSGDSGGQAEPSGGQAEGQSSEAESGGQQAGGEEGGGQPAGGEEGGGQSAGGEPEPSVDFRADRTQVQAGESTILRWDVENVREIYLDGQGVTGHETREVWPFPPNQTYILHVVLLNGEAQDHAVTIEVQGEIQLVSGPDLVVLAVDAPDRESDESVPFQAEVLNAGDAAAQGAQWRWSINRAGDGPSTWNQGGRFDLAVGQTTLLRGEAQPQPQGHWTIYLEVRVDGDGDQSNNRGSDNFDSVSAGGEGGPPPQVVPNPPPAPVLCEVYTVSSSSVGIQWGVQGMAEQDGFRIYLATTELVLDVGDYQAGLVQGLEPNTQYHFDVRAYNAGGESPADACAVDATTEP